uniref:Uncharacterized protein n=1 Tax=Anguilla anguilla TaxID=7936 RepID=A0A0E9U1G8_ANGAN
MEYCHLQCGTTAVSKNPEHGHTLTWTANTN